MMTIFPAFRCHWDEKGVTYSRPDTGTGMPSLERFRARPKRGVPRTVSSDQKYQFCVGQQPKPQIVLFVFYIPLKFLTDGVDSGQLPRFSKDFLCIFGAFPQAESCSGGGR